MPRMSQAEYDYYQARRATSGAKPQPPVRDASVGAEAGEATNPGKIHVRITSCRIRLIDPDNLCPKYFIDCLRYSGLIPDDRAEDITLEVRQVKVKTKTEERTEIELTIEQVL